MTASALITQGIERRRAIIKFVRAYSKKNGYSPSVREIAEGVDLISVTAVRQHLDTLRAEGWVTWTVGRYRSIAVAKSGRYTGH